MKPSNAVFDIPLPSRPSKTVSVRCPRCVQRVKCDYCAQCEYCNREIQQCTRCIIRNGCQSCGKCKECETKIKCLMCAKREECERCKNCPNCHKSDDPYEKVYVLNISKEPEGFQPVKPMDEIFGSTKIKKKGKIFCASCFSCCKLNEVNDLDIDEIRRNADSLPNHPLWSPILWVLFIMILIFASICWASIVGLVRARTFVNNHTFFKYDGDGHVSRITGNDPDNLPGNTDLDDIYEERRPWPQYVDYTGSWMIAFFPLMIIGVLSIFVIITTLIGKGIDVQDRRFQRLLVVTSVVLLLIVAGALGMIFGITSYMNGFEKARAYELHLTQTSTFVLDEIYEQFTLHRLVDIDMMYMIDAERIKISEANHGRGMSHETLLEMAINNTLFSIEHQSHRTSSNMFSRMTVDNGITQAIIAAAPLGGHIGNGIIQSMIATNPIGEALMIAGGIQGMMDSFSSIPNLFDSNPQVKTIDTDMILKQIDWIRSREFMVTRFSLEKHEGYFWLIILSFGMFILSIVFAYYMSDIFYGYVRIKHGFTWDNT